MVVLHVTENSKEIEVVTLLAHNVNERNHLSVIQREDGSILMTGGHLIHYSADMMDNLKRIPIKELYHFLLMLKFSPSDDTVAEYYERGMKFKRGEVVVARHCYGTTYTDEPALTIGKLYGVIEGNQKAPAGDLITILDDKGREIKAWARFFGKELNKQ